MQRAAKHLLNPNPLRELHRLAASFRRVGGVSAAASYPMLKVYNCIATEHDLKLVGLAPFVCVLSSFTAINLLRHGRKSTGQMRSLWLEVSAISTGFGIWATHFVAMLAFSPGIPSGYNIT